MFIHHCKPSHDGLEITFSDQTKGFFSLLWLRDHSTDSTSLNPSTLQRDFETFNLPSTPTLKQFMVTEDAKKLELIWAEDKVESLFNADLLYQLTNPTAEVRYQLWDSGLQGKVKNFDFNQVTSSDAAFLDVLEAFESHGIVTFSDMPTNMQATKELLEQVGYIRETVFGGLWDFSNNDAHSDSAYTSVGIGPHTDGTYTIDPPGLQLLHCLEFTGSGGENQFIDGFQVAQTIKETDPQAFETLKSVAVPAHYIEPGIQLRAHHPVITENAQGQFQQICFNNFDRSPMLLSKEKQQEFYHAYGLFHRLINDPSYQITNQLQPGEAVWFDNWRVLHARSPFTGFRHIAGGYSNKEDFISKLLTLRGQTPWLQ